MAQNCTECPKLRAVSEIWKITITSVQCCGSGPTCFLGLPDPDQLVISMNPDPALDRDPSIIVQK
jgi:hypothetical protein